MLRLPSVRRAVVLTVAAILASAAPAFAAPDEPAGPKADAPKSDAPKSDAPKADAPKDAPPPADATPAPTLEQVLADLADTKFAVKRLDAATAAKQFHDPRLVPLLAKLLRDEHPDVRAAAIAALASRIDADQKKKSADALADRMGAIAEKAELDDERMKVITALHDLAQVGTIDALLDKVSYGTSLDEVDARCRAVANVPSPKAIEALISFMQKRHRDGTGYRAAANKALQYATGERGANDPDLWRAWWKEHEKTFDFAAAYEKRQADAQAKEEAADRREKSRERQKERREKENSGDGGEKKE